MIVTKISISIIIVGIIFARRNYAATKILYEIHIRDAHIERNEYAVTDNGNISSPNLIITGGRNTTILFSKDNIESIYRESTTYTANGYKAKFNYSIIPLGFGPRLNAQTLKDAVG